MHVIDMHARNVHTYTPTEGTPAVHPLGRGEMAGKGTVGRQTEARPSAHARRRPASRRLHRLHRDRARLFGVSRQIGIGRCSQAFIGLCRRLSLLESYSRLVREKFGDNIARCVGAKTSGGDRNISQRHTPKTNRTSDKS